MALTREGAGVMSSVQRHLAFLDSELVAAAVARSTFDVKALLRQSTTVFVQVSPDQLQAQRGYLRSVLGTLIRGMTSVGDERRGEVLCLIDEASAVDGLDAIEEALVRGRSAGIRLLLAYQSDSQVKAAFKGKPELVYDNSSTHIYLSPNSIETGERLSKSLGELTQCVEGASEGESRSDQHWTASGGGGLKIDRSSGRSWQVQGRALMRPEELLTMSRDLMIALIGGMPPILARRIRYYADPLFKGGQSKGGSLLVWLFVGAAMLAMTLLWAG
jgi:type IV secretion system protein VirD4